MEPFERKEEDIIIIFRALLIGAPGPRSEAGTPLTSFLGSGAVNLADSSGVCLTPLVSAGWVGQGSSISGQGLSISEEG